MPTVSAPSSKDKAAPQKPVDRNAPPKTMSSSNTVPTKGGKVTAMLFVIATLILFGLLAFFIYRSASSSNMFGLSTPVISELPENTNNSNLEIQGTAPKNSTIRVVGEKSTTEIKANKDGKFSGIISLEDEGKYTFRAIATKKILFWSRESAKSEPVSTTLDLSAPGITMPKLPKTTSRDKYTIKGKISEDAKVTAKVNDTETTIETDKDGNFEIDIKLKEGNNKVTIIAKDKADNETSTKESIVTYSKGAVITADNSSNSTQATGNGELPESAGILSDALNTLFNRYFVLAVIGVGILGYLSSSSFVWLLKTYKK